MGDNDQQRILNRLLDAEAHFNDEERQLAKMEIAWAKAALGFRTWGGQRFGHGERVRKMRSLLRVHEILEVFRRRFESGNTLAILNAVALCADENLPLPTWLATAYQSALQAFLQPGGPLSLDAVFQSPNLPSDTPKKAAGARLDWQLAGDLWLAANDIAASDDTLRSLDAVIDAVLSLGNYGVGKTKARELILMIENNQHKLLGHQPSKHLSRFLEKRRKR